MSRLYHPWYRWECYKDGFYEINTALTRDECEFIYADYFCKKGKFERDIPKVIKNWKYSCEHFLTNTSINRIAWLGQACVFFTTGVTPNYKYAYNNIDKEVRDYNNEIAKAAIDEFCKNTSIRLHQQVEMHGVFL